MNTSAFLRTLRQHPALPLVFRAGRATISPGYHLTEVKRVGYETMDCGAQTHRWSETQFELWVPRAAAAVAGRGHMPADKFARIVDRVEKELPLAGEATARIFASFEGQPPALYEIGAVTPRDGQLEIELSADRTRCKAAERGVAAATGGCCGSEENSAGESDAEEGCGCTPTGHRGAKLACCA